MNPGQDIFTFTLILMTAFIVITFVQTYKLEKLVKLERDYVDFWYFSLQKSITSPSYFKKHGEAAFKKAKEIRLIFFTYFWIGFSTTAYYIFMHS